MATELQKQRHGILREVLWTALEDAGLYMERVALVSGPGESDNHQAIRDVVDPSQSSEASGVADEAWVLGLTPSAIRREAEEQRLATRRVFRLQTPEGLTKTFLRWKSYKRSPGPGHGEAAESESEFNSAQVLSLLYRCAFQAVFPRTSDDIPEEFRDLDLLCQRHSVMSLALHGGVVDKVTALHDPSQRQRLWELWPRLRGGLASMPIDSIVTYFGIHTAEYFAFLHEYATWLLLPAVLGVAVQAVLSLDHDGLDAVAERRISQAFMVFMSVWTTAFIEHWKRCRSGLHYQFGARLEDRQAEAECEAPAVYCIETKRLARAFAAGSRQRAESDHKVHDLPKDKEQGLAGFLILFRFLRTVVAMSCLAAAVSGVVYLLLRLGELGSEALYRLLLQTMRTYDTAPMNAERQGKNKARKSFAIDAFLQKGLQWPLAVFMVSVLVLGLLLRALDGLFFSEEETSSCCWEIGLCAAATFGLVVASDHLLWTAGLAVASRPAKSKKAPKTCQKQVAAGRCAAKPAKPVSKPAGDDAKVAEVVAAVRAGNMELAEAKLLLLCNSWRLKNGDAVESVNAQTTMEAKMAERWLSFLAEKGMLRDLNAVITSNAKEKNPVAAERIVTFMCKHGIEPDVITLGAAVHAFAHAGQQKEAERMFDLILTRGKTRPDVIGFNALIDASVKVGDTKRAEYWLERMLEIGLEPNVVSYTTVLHAHAKHGNIEAAETMMKLMKSNGIAANVVTYTALVNACVKAGDLPCAERWFDEMQSAGVQANAVSYSALLNVSAKAGDFKRAERLLERMCQDRVCFNNVIDACSKAGHAARAEHWLWRLAEGKDLTADLAPTRQSFTAAAQAHAKLGSFGDVERLFRAMEVRGISMDAFCLTALRKYHSQGFLGGAHRLRSSLLVTWLAITKPPLRVAKLSSSQYLLSCLQWKSVLGAQRLEQLCAEMGMKVPDLSDFAEERRPWRRH
eukprot:s597_g9.t1